MYAGLVRGVAMKEVSIVASALYLDRPFFGSRRVAVLRKGVQVRARMVLRLQEGKLVGITEARYHERRRLGGAPADGGHARAVRALKGESLRTRRTANG
jgi:hypothetical protein